MKIVEIQQRPELFDTSVGVFWREWGNEKNYNFYEDAMRNSCLTTDEIPRFYIALEDESIIGTYALIRNDLNSRQDLFPWLACLFVEPGHRGKQIGSQLLQHALQEAAKKGFDRLYLSTDLDGYYEKYGWTHFGEVYGVGGGSLKIYSRSVE